MHIQYTPDSTEELSSLERPYEVEVSDDDNEDGYLEYESDNE